MTHLPLSVLVLSLSLTLGACGDRDADAPDDPSTVPGGNGSNVLATPDGANDPSDGADASLLLVVADENGLTLADPGEEAMPLVTGRPGDVDDLFDVGGTIDGGDAFDVDATPFGDDTFGLGTAPDDELFGPGSTGGDDGTGIGLDGQAVFVPSIPGDPDAARVLDGLRLALERTLLDLNARLAGGIALEAQRNDCLGAYDPARGEPLTAVDCTGALATEPVAIYVERGAFYPTAACRAALAGGRADDCVLAYASVFDRVEFVQAPGERRPRPLPGSGVAVRYGLDGPVLSVRSGERAPTGVFRCEIDLATGATLPGAIGDCDTLLADVAASFDVAFAEVR